MQRFLTFLRHALRFLFGAVVSLVVWTLWLGLVIVLGFQIYIATTNELEIPKWLLRSIEQRLESSGIHAKFGRTSLDPTGNLFFEDASLVLPSFNEPVLTASGVFVRLDLRALLSRHFEPTEIHVTGGSWLVPAMLSPSGRSEPLVRDFDLRLRPQHGGELVIEALSARLSTLEINARGTVYLPEPEATGKPAMPAPDFIAARYAAACRQLLAAAEKLDAFEEPSVEVELAPSESRAAIANVILTARSLKLVTPLAVEAHDLRARARFPLLGETPVMSRLEFTAEELYLPRDTQAQGVHAAIRGSLRPAKFQFEPTEIELAADAVSTEGITATALAGHFTTGPYTQLHSDVVVRAFGSPLAIVADTDFAAKTATIHFEGAIAPGWLDVVSQRVGRDVRIFVDFATPIIATSGEATFGAGWKFERLTAHVDTPTVDAYHVRIDEAHGRVELTPQRFYAPEAYARIGKNFGRGSYEHRFTSTQQFRFLLEGQLEPLAISGWFGPWWPNFFSTFDFPGGPPSASVDVSGFWREGKKTSVFVFADVNSPVIRGARLDRARTLLFIRPGYYDGLETYGTLDQGFARGTFTYRLEPTTFVWRQFDFAGVSSIALATAGQLIGPISDDWLRPFKFEEPPTLQIKGRLEHDASDNYRQNVQIDGRAEKGLRLQDFPLEYAVFKAVVHDDEISIDDIQAGFAGGVTTGQAKISGRGDNRRLSFNTALQGASLGRAVTTFEQFTARRNGTEAPAPEKSIQEKNNVRLDLAATAEGNLTDALSYHGRGVADLKGAGLGEVRMLGGLSETLRFTALHFTAANAAFRIEGTKVVFPEVSITGENSAIQAHGEYALDRKQLDFNAKVYPFQESGFILKKILDVALSPLSNVFEVKLTGSLDKPSWGLVLGPSNFLRSFNQPGHDETPGKSEAAVPASSETPTPKEPANPAAAPVAKP
jgi:hypothetical protein